MLPVAVRPVPCLYQDHLPPVQGEEGTVPPPHGEDRLEQGGQEGPVEVREGVRGEAADLLDPDRRYRHRQQAVPDLS